MDGGAWWATVHGVSKSRTWLKQLGTHTHTHTHFVLGALQSEVQNGLLCASYICGEGEKDTRLPQPM